MGVGRGRWDKLKKVGSGDWKQGYCNGHLSNGEGGLNFGAKTPELNTAGAPEERAARKGSAKEAEKQQKTQCKGSSKECVST